PCSAAEQGRVDRRPTLAKRGNGGGRSRHRRCYCRLVHRVHRHRAICRQTRALVRSASAGRVTTPENMAINDKVMRVPMKRYLSRIVRVAVLSLAAPIVLAQDD